MTGRRKTFWDVTTPVSRPLDDAQLSKRGYFLIGCGVGFANALLLLLAVVLICDLLSWGRS